MTTEWKQMIARYDGDCCLCGKTVKARAHIAHGGKGRTAHSNCYHAATDTAPLPSYCEGATRAKMEQEREHCRAALAALSVVADEEPAKSYARSAYDGRAINPGSDPFGEIE